MRKFRNQLMLSYLPLVVVPVILIALVTRGAAEQGLTLLVSRGARQQIETLTPCLATYYSTLGSWEGLANLIKPSGQPRFVVLPNQKNLSVPAITSNDIRNVFLVGDPGIIGCYQVSMTNVPATAFQLYLSPVTSGGESAQTNPLLSSLLSRLPDNSDHPDQSAPSVASLDFRGRFRPEETVVTDPKGVILASTSGKGIGQQLASDALDNSFSITVGDTVVGKVIVGTSLGLLNQAQNQLLDTVNLALLVSGALSVLLAVGLGWLMSWEITLPVRDLMAGVKRLAAGAWSAPLVVRSRNEFGDLTHAFNNMAHEIIRQQQLNRQMIADIAHDLRTPLSTMSLEVEAIEAGFQTPAEATTSLREEIMWLQRMVDDLRTLSLMDADQIQLQIEEVPLRNFVGGVYDFWLIMAEEEKRDFQLDMPEELPAVPIDPGRMRQILGNLIDNAIRHTRPGDAITLTAHLEGNQAVLRVSDQGEGIHPDDLPHVFDRFYRADPARRRDGGSNNSGSGLGLSIARRLVEMHHGTIGVVSKPGHGTAFTIRLPLTALNEIKEKKGRTAPALPAHGSAGVSS